MKEMNFYGCESLSMNEPWSLKVAMLMKQDMQSEKRFVISEKDFGTVCVVNKSIK